MTDESDADDDLSAQADMAISSMDTSCCGCRPILFYIPFAALNRLFQKLDKRLPKGDVDEILC